MEKIERNSDEDFPATTLYLDDLKDILRAVSSVCKKVEIRTEDYKLNNLEEIDTLAEKYTKGRFPNIYVQSYEPHFSLNIATSRISIYTNQGTFELKGLIAEVKGIANRGKKPFYTLRYRLFYIVLSLLGGFLVFSGNYEFWGPLVAVYFGVAAWLIPIELRNRVVVKTQPRGSTPNFFKRNRDNIILAAFSALLGALFGSLGTYIVTRFLLSS